jgi:hypothetical protein
MERMYKAIAAAALGFLGVLVGDVDVIPNLPGIWDAVTVAIVNGIVVYAIPNYDYPARTRQ